MINIESLRKMKNADFGAITAEIEKIVNPQSNNFSNDDDGRWWKPTKDKAGNASAEIRFLPKTEGDQLPWVKTFSYGFQGPTGKWYIESCLSTIGEKDPVNESNYELRKTGLESDKKLAQSRGRRTHYISNVYIVNDPANPDNNGKTFLFKYGKKIFDKIMDKAKPTFEDETPVNVFCPFEGASFKLRMKQVDGYPNYDASVFSDASPLCGGDEEKMISALNSQYQLSEFIDKSKFKSYEELSRKFQSVINPMLSASPSAHEMTESYTPPVKQESTSNYTTQSTPSTESNGTDDDIMEFFKKLQND